MDEDNQKQDSGQTTEFGVSRRSFLSRLGIAGAAAAAGPALTIAQAASRESTSTTEIAEETIEGSVPIVLRVNGERHRVQLDPRTTLLDALRETIRLTGTKKGCDHGQCGACTVHINGRRVNSCLSLAVMHEDEEITTIEGLGAPDNLHPVQASFLQYDGYQCGYCTSGQMMSAAALLREPCGPSNADVKELMSGNICRCGAYPNIVAAIQHARHEA
ncbi:MAG TPA: 2Fe-2S iron-sulfur cluster-binding protein [Bryobacteraceae bacterium]|jgi:xanthine dehydrogenase YagT iron-sulfur-binding subunit|nr:2Fe-2S iron-sulfur cluster-binding protein [Bryobacteraceae bacterium]